MSFTFKKKTKCGQNNIKIARITENGRRRFIYYTECKCSESAAEKFRELRVESGITPIPFWRPGQRIGPICVAASSGSGKSTYCRRLVDEILELAKVSVVKKDNGDYEYKHPEEDEEKGPNPEDLKIRAVYLLTAAKSTDPAFEGLPPVRLDIDDAMQNGAQIEDFRNAVVVFDDFKNKNRQFRAKFDWVNSLRDDLLDKSRKLGAHLIICNHRQRAGHDTALENIEAQAFVVFYRSNKNETRKLLKNYVDMKNAQIDQLIEMDNGMFSSAYINRNPSYIITNNYMYFY